MLLSFVICNADAKISFKRIKNVFLATKKVKKPPQKVAYLWQLGGFFSAAPTAQNSLEVHFPFINYFVQSSLVRSLVASRLLDILIFLLQKKPNNL